MQKTLANIRYVSVDHLVTPETPSYRHLCVGKEFQAALYEHLKSFWYSRHNTDLPHEEINKLLDKYKKTYFRPERAPVRQLLDSLSEARKAGEPLSIIDLGCANGTTLHYLRTIHDLSDVRFVGVEPYKVFTDNFAKNFPDQTIIQGNAETFPDIDFSRYLNLPVTTVYFGGVLCMVSPEAAKRCLAKAAEMTDWITGFDYCLNTGGEIDCKDGETVMFEYNLLSKQVYFAHHYVSFFRDIGFNFEMGDPIIILNFPSYTNRKEWRVFSARRKSATGRSRSAARRRPTHKRGSGSRA